MSEYRYKRGKNRGIKLGSEGGRGAALSCRSGGRGIANNGSQI